MEKINSFDRAEREAAARETAAKIRSGEIVVPEPQKDVNNHVHTIYSFSPYSPYGAVWEAKKAGLLTVGIMDHDSVGGIKEFLDACKLFDMFGTVGLECRADMSKTKIAGHRINNPDQNDIAYIALHAIPHDKVNQVDDFFAPLRKKRNERNVKMLDRINALTSGDLDFEKDVLPLSKADEGGSVTERHLLYALAKSIIKKCGKGQKVVEYVKKLGMPLSEKVIANLSDEQNPHYDYDLLGFMKANLVKDFYIPATDECADVNDVKDLAKSVGAVFTYAYLGDVGASVTGDKAAQKFEDDYLDDLFDCIKKIGFDAVTYMPSRNTAEQITRLKGLCTQYGFMEISGEDINSSRQKFVCEKQRSPEFANLYDSAFALIGNENAADHGVTTMFRNNTFETLEEKIKYYAVLGKK